MKTKQSIINAYLLAFAGVVMGILLGWWWFGDAPKHETEHVHAETGVPEVWTCSMHPQIRQDKPGKCPLCAMDLIPVRTAGATDEALSPESIVLSPEAAALANVRTTRVSRSHPVKEITLYGSIQPDERLARSQVAHTGGRIEQLFVNFTGETIRQGQKIATLYSPDLLNAQQELLEAIKIVSTQPARQPILEAAREKLRLLKLTDAQIKAIESSGQANALVDVVANASGIVTAKKVAEGDYVNPGSILFELTDLTQVWAMFDAYEADLPYLKTGDAVRFTVQALPGKTYTGRIAFIDPSLDKTTRTARLRVETSNPGLLLKPEMYANAVVEAPLRSKSGSIVVPRSAVLWTGKRSIVYVKQADASTPIFTLREIELGASLGDAYIVLSGIDEGEEIVTSGVFAVDASAQLEGKRSMMNTEISAPSSGEQATFTVQGLCEMCKERIENAARKVNGVIFASWDMATRQLQLSYDPRRTSPAAVAQALAQAGHDTDTYQAAAATYNALPDCCKYRNNKQ